MSVRRFVRIARRGHHFGYPTCCVLRFSVAAMFGARHQAEKRGFHRTPDGLGRFVPCHVFHATEDPWGGDGYRDQRGEPRGH